MLQFVFPGLARTEEVLDLLGEAHLPMLSMLLTRGRHETIPQTDLAARLCQEFGIPRQLDWPVAAITFAHAGGQPAREHWLRADPVHVRIERDRLILNEIPSADPQELESLRVALATHFGEAFSPQALRPGAWVVRTTESLEISTTPLSLAAGQHIDPLLPAGKDAMHWRKLLNEAQMLLFSHPVNQAREARGEPAINSVWLWGGGGLPDSAMPGTRTVCCDDPDSRALAEFAGARTGKLPEGWSPELAEDALIVLEAPHSHLRQGDFKGWLNAMQDFEQHWLAPLVAAGRRFRLDDPLNGDRLVWRPAYRWKFWRRPQKTMQQPFSLQQPAADPGVDAFGNRY